ncbi:hypothetical protein AMYX_13790 [Anaeromyxobacter diazotrophicus]|uniref:Uncharacterized protein n=1 Tax=Anaeromyxobacter diazotrophicus TaxID=2590199 RepID=A0A7I9VKB8_9BACT|nr:hypothetical protein AMYX_13790 [Anaeromyxobacter diazotrophicus]
MPHLLSRDSKNSLVLLRALRPDAAHERVHVDAQPGRKWQRKIDGQGLVPEFRVAQDSLSQGLKKCPVQFLGYGCHGRTRGWFVQMTSTERRPRRVVFTLASG